MVFNLTVIENSGGLMYYQTIKQVEEKNTVSITPNLYNVLHVIK